MYENCDELPEVAHATAKRIDDENDDSVVSYVYTCDDGYRLKGEAELFCDYDTDEWQGDPPTCEKGKT